MESNATFFPGTPRKIILGSPTLQAGNTNSRRIKIPIRMPLDTDSVLGMPDWLSNAYTDAAQKYTEVYPEVQQISEVLIAFSDKQPKAELFEHPDARLDKAEIRAFTVVRAGNAEAPDIELHFNIFAPYARDFWKWLGEKAGHEVQMALPPTMSGKVDVVRSGDLPLEAATEEMPDEPTLEDEFGEQPEAEDKPRRGRPRKN